MKAQLIRDMDCKPTDEWPEGKKPKGTVIDHPQAARLCQMGVAIPADEECQLAAHMTPERMRAAKYAYERATKGIAAEDFAAYDAGEMVGYNPDGSFKPGPNYIPDDDEDELDESEDCEDDFG